MSFHVLIIGYVWPEPQSSAAGLRDWNLIEALLQEHWKITFASSAKENLFSQRLKDRGIEIHSIQANDSGFDIWIEQLSPDFVIFDRFVIEEQFGWRVKSKCPDAVRVLDTQDLHFLRRAREKAVASQEALDLKTDDTWRELGSIYRSDGTLILSSFEMSVLTEQFQIPQTLIHLTRFHYPPVQKTKPNFDSRKNFVMIGNFRHRPNADGVLWLKQEIWPLIKKELKDAEVHIYGAYPTKEMTQLNDTKQGFLIKGPVNDQMAALEKYRVNLAPLRFGAGIKGKITDGWWVGTPVVTTPIGAEGMSDQFAWGGEIAESSHDFANRAIQLYTVPTLWEEAQNRGYTILGELYLQKTNSAQLIQILKEIKENLNEIRRDNSIGSILNFHLYRSTEYFSRWIEEKNRVGCPPKGIRPTSSSP